MLLPFFVSALKLNVYITHRVYVPARAVCNALYVCYDCVKIEISERGYTHLNVLHLVCVCVFEIQVAGADCGLDLCILFICSRPGEKPQQQNRIGASRIQTKYRNHYFRLYKFLFAEMQTLFVNGLRAAHG